MEKDQFCLHMVLIDVAMSHVEWRNPMWKGQQVYWSCLLLVQVFQGMIIEAGS